MAHNHIANYISKTIKSIIFLWSTIFIFTIGLLFFYDHENKKNIFLKEQLLSFSRINNEIITTYYKKYHNNPIYLSNFEDSKIHEWIQKNRNDYEKFLQNSHSEIDSLEKLAVAFFSSKNNNKNQMNKFEDLTSQINILEKLTLDQMKNSPIYVLSILIFPISLGILMILIFISIIFANQLKQKIILKNELILDDIWQELQEINKSEDFNSLIFMPRHSENTALLHSLIRDLINKIEIIVSKIGHYKKKITLSLEKFESLSRSVFDYYEKQSKEKDEYQIKDKIYYIQKILGKLLIKSKRISSLAKTSIDNGFQANILSLNISIESSKIGEYRQYFSSVSEKIKDFAEKSTYIGDIIFEDLKESNLSIRKAYAATKTLIEDQKLAKDPKTLIKLDIIEELQEIKNYFDDMSEISKELCNKLIEIEISIESPNRNDEAINTIYLKKIELMKSIIIKNFEQLYIFNYGIKPPSIL